MINNETQQSIAEWQRATFGKPRSNMQSARRVREELNELLDVLYCDDDSSYAAEEIADIVILLAGLATRLGASIADEVDRKMQINRLRTWISDGNDWRHVIEVTK